MLNPEYWQKCACGSASDRNGSSGGNFITPDYNEERGRCVLGCVQKIGAA